MIDDYTRSHLRAWCETETYVLEDAEEMASEILRWISEDEEERLAYALQYGWPSAANHAYRPVTD
jgi:hypothetical protein